LLRGKKRNTHARRAGRPTPLGGAAHRARHAQATPGSSHPALPIRRGPTWGGWCLDKEQEWWWRWGVVGGGLKGADLGRLVPGHEAGEVGAYFEIDVDVYIYI